MTTRISKAQMIAHLAAIAEKSKIEDSDFLFFKDGVYKGEWQPNAVPNTLPTNAQANDIYLIASDGSYFGREIQSGDLVRIMGNNQPVLIYSKYIPVAFILSMLDEAPSNNAGSGFVFGGEWDATGTEILSTAEFNVLIDCVVSGNTLVPSASQFGATSQNLSKTDVGTQMTFKVTWPDTSAGFFMVGLHTSSLENALAASNDETASFVGIGAAGGTVLSLLRNGATFSQDPAGISINAGDVVILGYRPAVSLLYISNETQNTFNILQLSLYPDFQTSQVNLALYAQLNTAIAFEFPSEYSMQQVDYSLELPTDFSKTYRVSNANINSAVNGKLLKQGDFVRFFEHDNITDVLVSRLLTDNDINSLAQDVAQTAISQALQANGSIYNAIQQAVNP